MCVCKTKCIHTERSKNLIWNVFFFFVSSKCLFCYGAFFFVVLVVNRKFQRHLLNFTWLFLNEKQKKTHTELKDQAVTTIGIGAGDRKRITQFLSARLKFDPFWRFVRLFSHFVRFQFMLFSFGPSSSFCCFSSFAFRRLYVLEIWNLERSYFMNTITNDSALNFLNLFHGVRFRVIFIILQTTKWMNETSSYSKASIFPLLALPNFHTDNHIWWIDCVRGEADRLYVYEQFEYIYTLVRPFIANSCNPTLTHVQIFILLSKRMKEKRAKTSQIKTISMPCPIFDLFSLLHIIAGCYPEVFAIVWADAYIFFFL